MSSATEAHTLGPHTTGSLYTGLERAPTTVPVGTACGWTQRDWRATRRVIFAVTSYEGCGLGPGSANSRGPLSLRDRTIVLLPCMERWPRSAEADVLAYLVFPEEHWRSISSTNAIERVNAEIDRRAKVVGIFPNAASLLRLTTAVLQEQHDEWQDGRRHFSSRAWPGSTPRRRRCSQTRSRRASPHSSPRTS